MLSSLFKLLLLLVLLAAGAYFGGSEYLVRRTIDIDLPQVKAATAPADLAEGARLARLAGCLVCHGDKGQGRVLVDDERLGRIVAPSLARVASDATDGQIARAIRNGISIRARPLFVMPAAAYNSLSDQDLARIVGWIRSVKPSTDDIIGAKRLGPMGRLALLAGKLPDSVAAAGGQPAQRPADIGRYLVAISCLSCHALNADKQVIGDAVVAPALARASARYDPAAFATLLRTGKAIDGHQLRVMSAESRAALDVLTDEEIAAIHAYLRGVN